MSGRPAKDTTNRELLLLAATHRASKLGKALFKDRKEVEYALIVRLICFSNADTECKVFRYGHPRKYLAPLRNVPNAEA